MYGPLNNISVPEIGPRPTVRRPLTSYAKESKAKTSLDTSNIFQEGHPKFKVLRYSSKNWFESGWGVADRHCLCRSKFCRVEKRTKNFLPYCGLTLPRHTFYDCIYDLFLLRLTSELTCFLKTNTAVAKNQIFARKFKDFASHWLSALPPSSLEKIILGPP